MNFVLEPRASYEDPLGSFFDDSLVERRVDKMINFTPQGVDSSDQEICNYDAQRIKQFKDSIELINGEYHVDLVWHDNVNKVQSNHSIALNVLDRVSNKLENSQKLHEYVEIFKDLEQEGVIERIKVNPKEFYKYVWIPHRPVFKDSETSTTKMRPVFNASLKTKKGTPSLNEASYCGINLMKDMTELLMLFRTNKYTYTADIRRAFLMIKFLKIQDRNRFCFFLKDGDQLICFRFTTIIFGFNASPFILNYVLQYHINTFANDECTEILKNHFFVDNLVKTLNDEDKLIHLYKNSIARLGTGNFELRSCNTNSVKLKQIMIKDNKYVEHNCEYEKVLGYNYNPSKDTLQLAKVKFKDSEKVTKRSILSESAKVFDPLNLASPVTMKSKILISKLWKEKKSDKHWDEEVSVENQGIWNPLKADLQDLSELEFPRFSLAEAYPMDLYIFCDASKSAYGFVVYAVQNGVSNLIFSKSKVAPLQSKSIPQLELLSVVLAYKNLLNLF